VNLRASSTLASVPAAALKLRFSEIDSLRAVACACVIVYHIVWQFNKVTESGTWLYDLCGHGGLGLFGVMAFFAISGYVIPDFLRGPRLAGAKRFVIRRFWRLYPPFWVVLLWACIAKFSTLGNKDFLWSLTMLPSAVGVNNVLGHFWTLEVELLFYVLLLVFSLLFGHSGLLGGGSLFATSLLLLFVLPSSHSLWLKLPLFFSIMFWSACCREVTRLNFLQSVRIGLPKWLCRAVLIGGMTGLLTMWPLNNIYFGILDEEGVVVEQFSPIFFSIIAFLFWVILRPVRIQSLAMTWSLDLLHLSLAYDTDSRCNLECAKWSP